MNGMIKIAFADLIHTNKYMSNRAFPYGIGLIASYLKKELKDSISVELFKYPNKFSKYLENNNPQIICFHNSLWTQNLCYEYAKRIKENSPKTIIIFGGPNYPLEESKQKSLLQSHPSIDFYIQGEGEIALFKLFEKLKEFNFNLREFKKNKIKSGNCHYIKDRELIRGETLPRILDLDVIPSPYLTGMLDKFFNGILDPILQTTRGCPFNCAYCQEGQSYFNRIARFSIQRIKDEINYISKKAKVNELLFADSNFGMYKEDVEICKAIASARKKYGFPKFFGISFGKDKNIILNMLSMLKDGTLYSIPVQSTDNEVLENINRRNIEIKKLMSIAKEGRVYRSISFSEIILGLPGDTKEKHFRSVLDMIDADADVVRAHQLLMLTGSEISTNNIRNRYGFVTRFRIQPRCFGEYEVYGKKFSAFEIDEIVIANNTLSDQDYLDCRSFNLTIEIFYNSLFRDLINFLIYKKISISSFILKVHKRAINSDLKEYYNNFLRENEDSLWESEHDLKKHMNFPGVINKITENNLRENEQLKYRALIILEKIKSMHEIAFEVAQDLLIMKGLTEEDKTYLNEFKRFSLLMKSDFFIEKNILEEFHYNFIQISKNNFKGDPQQFYVPSGIKIRFFNLDKQIDLISQYIKQYGSSPEGLGYILSRSDIKDFYKKIGLGRSKNE